MEQRNPNSETGTGDYSCSLLQLFNGGPGGRVDTAQLRK